jgi:hypothetical protein
MSQRFSLSDRFVTLEARIKRIEDALPQIFSRLTALENPSLSLAGDEPIVLPSSEIKEGHYVYRALDTARNEVRILVAYGNSELPSGDQDIICELLHVSLDHESYGVRGEASESRGMLETEALRKFNTLSYTVGVSFLFLVGFN